MEDIATLRAMVQDLLNAEANVEAARALMRREQSKFEELHKSLELLHKALFKEVGNVTRYLDLNGKIVKIEGLSHGMAYVSELIVER
jgi:hypothetical protein